MTKLSSSFEERSDFQGTGGELSTDTFFSGEKVGLFGGISYQLESLPLTAMIEYNPDRYEWEQARGGRAPESSISAALKWDALPGVAITVSRQHNEEWGIALNAYLDSKILPPKPSVKLFRSSLDYAADELPVGLDKDRWYDMLLFDVERSDLLLLEATLDVSTRTATLVIGNTGYTLWADAISATARLADLHLPMTVNTFNIILEEEGYRTHSVRLRRPSLTYGRNRQIVEREIRVAPAESLAYVQHKTNFVTKKIVFDVNLATRTQLFDPDDPLRYQFYAEVGVELALPSNWALRGSFGYDINNNFDQSRRADSGSVLPRVRSDVVKYLVQGDTGLDSLYLEKRGNWRSDVYYRAFGGILEDMYSGVGGELLYQPFQSRLAFGLSANWVRKRDFDKSFKHLDYSTSTAFASVYWATPFYNVDMAVHAGRYLAKDVGATLEVRRTFSNGWMVGLWATKTDVSAADFGEGSFDKGMFFKIPLDNLIGGLSWASFGNRMRPIQRDGGQRLESHSGTIWWDTRPTRYDALSETSNRMVP
ncbi:YjbH domain-containing protein [Porticoccaceae bacterium]|nr:YjbH domain-containing protein [Porticoccaceae bacterium]